MYNTCWKEEAEVWVYTYYEADRGERKFISLKVLRQYRFVLLLEISGRQSTAL
jgi:hypothetical protein